MRSPPPELSQDSQCRPLNNCKSLPTFRTNPLALGTLIFSQSVIHTKERQAERIQEGKDPGVPWAFLRRHQSSSELVEPTPFCVTLKSGKSSFPPQPATHPLTLGTGNSGRPTSGHVKMHN